ncbi:hypothetical protein TWF225_009765 [Orbilia oligospora]|uniref:Uncharacterized protein n=1 Tax=Orbilia oligospora TaxID=2813651 RepID=A0A7C8KJH4_ORBOL|nr:hypothetical protein TWF751_006604 [Orbilia oligospora]KAF3173489.1 hypothetical protein TWF225_009765 [Orbilia oligospora]KAF3239572.1 hypothetical protein TWF217_001241 [Orbilia oligospora]KAF3261215.1 hypothetical protein TWF128_003010 [Orbilia oligospora]KAF3277386.1 hypothetical protein TWF132_001688 [Orbilia oligospora]
MASFPILWLSKVANRLQSFGFANYGTQPTSTISINKTPSVPEVSRPAAVNAVPYEIWVMIYDYLATKELKAISSCSRLHRERLIPLLYAHILLSEASIQGFQSGNLKYCRSLVREVTFDGLCDDSSIHKTIDLCSLYCASLEIFPNLMGVHIPFATTTNYEAAIPRAIARKLSSYPLFKNLRKLCFEAKFISYEDPAFGNWDITRARLSIEEKDFFGNELTGTSSKQEEYDFFPDSLEVASGFSFEGSLFVRPFKTPFLRQFYYPWTFYFNSASKLKSLTIHMLHGFGRHKPAVVFPEVQFLHIIVKHGINSKMIDIMSEMCPAVQHLYLEGQHSNSDTSQRSGGATVYYLSIRKFEYLRTARLPWPYNPDARLNHNSRWATAVVLSHSVKHWTGYLSNSFYMTSLQRVDFAKSEKQDINPIPYSSVGPNSIEEGVTEVIRLLKREDGNWGRDSSFNQQEPEYWDPYWDYSCH